MPRLKLIVEKLVRSSTTAWPLPARSMKGSRRIGFMTLKVEDTSWLQAVYSAAPERAELRKTTSAEEPLCNDQTCKMCKCIQFRRASASSRVQTWSFWMPTTLRCLCGELVGAVAATAGMLCDVCFVDWLTAGWHVWILKHRVRPLGM